MEKQVIFIDSATSPPPKDGYGEHSGKKRKECSTSTYSSPIKLQRKRRRYVPSHILQAVGRRLEFGDDVNLKDDPSRVYGSSPDLPILILDSDIGFDSFNQSRFYGTTTDIPMIILDSDSDSDANDGWEGYFNPHQLPQTPPLSGRGCVEASASKQVKEWTNIPIIILDSEDIDANTEYLHQKDSLIETAQEIPKYPPQINDVDGVANDDFSKLWDEMTVALECSKDSPAAAAATGECVEEHGDECDHSLILKDDLGHVCRICGVIQKGIDTIIEFPSPKGKRSARTYEPRSTRYSP